MANLSQEKRQRMLDFLSALKEEHKNDDDALIALNEIETELNAKKYGLVWEKHEEAADMIMRENIPVFTECREREITAAPEGKQNFILEGDNLHSLRLLKKTHLGKIDMIYIDPPYNLGNDFIYNDSYVGTEDGYRHSKWLSFMEERLKTAFQLLSPKGAIFISIDDTEYAALKLLCDELFSEQNYQATLIWKSRQRADSRNVNMLSTDHEYILVYGKSDEFSLVGRDKDISKYSNPDDDPRGPWASIDLSGLADASRRPNLHYDIVDPETGNVYPPNPNRGWSKSRETVDLMISENRILWPSSPTGRPREKKFLKDLQSDKTGFSSVLDNKEVGYTTDGTRALTKVLGTRAFNFPKSVKLLKTLISQFPDDGCTVLDFFAGSGTTGQAVLELNAEDGGNRSFILCTDNENNICEEVTYERIRRVIEGYDDVEGIPANVKYYQIDFVSKDSDDVTGMLLGHMPEMIELEHGAVEGGYRFVIVFNDKGADDFEKDWDDFPDLQEIYIANSVLLTAPQQALFGKVKMTVIPDRYFKYELQEVGESW